MFHCCLCNARAADPSRFWYSDTSADIHVPLCMHVMCTECARDGGRCPCATPASPTLQLLETSACAVCGGDSDNSVVCSACLETLAHRANSSGVIDIRAAVREISRSDAYVFYDSWRLPVQLKGYTPMAAVIDAVATKLGGAFRVAEYGAICLLTRLAIQTQMSNDDDTHKTVSQLRTDDIRLMLQRVQQQAVHQPRTPPVIRPMSELVDMAKNDPHNSDRVTQFVRALVENRLLHVRHTIPEAVMF